MASAVIFDIDGTLIDSVDIHTQAWRDAFAKFGKDVPFMDIRRQIGKGGDQLMPVFLSKEELEEFGEQLEKFRGEHYKEAYMERVKPFAMVPELFERITRDGKQIALASSAKEDELNFYKGVAGVEPFLKATTSADDAEKSKPHPDIFQAALARLEGADPATALVIGDSPYDAEAASKAGMRTIGVLCGGFKEEDLRNAGCVAIYTGPAHLLFEFDSSPLANG